MEMGDITNLMDYTSSLASASNVDKTAKASSSAKTDEEMLDACKEFESYLWEQRDWSLLMRTVTLFSIPQASLLLLIKI